ncbi:MAG: DUF1269 domain-containing protein, partial [Aquificales bacterium]|nr:DUF1269 domain-containing protein [Aquificales bacterium]
NETEFTHHEIIIALFEGKDGASDAVQRISDQASDTVPDLKGQTAVIAMDENGKISSSTAKAKGKTVKGAALGGIVGLLIGLPIGGVIVGGIIGYTRRGKKQAGSDDDQVTLEQIADHMEPDSSVIVAEVEDWQASTVADALHMNGAVKVIHAQKDNLAELIEKDDSEN